MERSCKFCGTNVVPYPLSTRESCGDPLYSRFYCDNETSQLYFTSSNALYRVTNIIPKLQKFAISIDDNKTSCTSKDLLNKTLQLDHSSYFYLISGCNSSRNFILNSFSQDQVLSEVEIGWSAPPMPSCASNNDCADWLGTTCNAVGDGKKICHCNANPSWNPSSNCTLGEKLVAKAIKITILHYQSIQKTKKKLFIYIVMYVENSINPPFHAF